MKSWNSELKLAIKAGIKAKEIVMEIYNKPFAVEIKDDDSPVTSADKKCDKFLRDYLSKHFPTYGFLTEESCDDFKRLKKKLIWIIDPVDGTKDFVAKDNEFAINIALCYKHKIVVGVVVIPAYDEIYFASLNHGAFYQKGQQNPIKIHVNDKITDLTVFSSVFHFTDEEKEIIERNKDRVSNVVKKGSALKGCLIAKGEGEVTIRTSGMTKEWDTAAPQIIVEEAGGVFLGRDGKEITYNREDVYNRAGYIVANRKENLLK